MGVLSKPNIINSITFWSDLQATVTIASTASDLDFPSVTISGLSLRSTPYAATYRIHSAILLLKYAQKEDTSGSANAINGTNKTIRVMESGGAWGTDDIIAIDIPDNTLATAASTKEGGDIIIGNHDIKSVVTGDLTILVRSEQTNRGDAILVDGDSLILRDVQCGIKVYLKST